MSSNCFYFKNFLAFALLFSFAAFLLAEEEKTPKTYEEREKDKEDVIKKIEELLLPTPVPINDGKEMEEMPPYIKIIPGSDERTTVIYKCRNVKSKSILDALEGMISSSGTVEESADQNMVVINDASTKTEDFKSALIAMDVKNPQILVEAKIVEVSVDESMQRDVKVEYTKVQTDKGLTNTYGYNLTSPSQVPLNGQGGGFNFFPYSSGTAARNLKDVNLFLQWLKTARDAKVLSSPNLIVDLGATASMVAAEDVPILQTQVNGGTVTTSIVFKRIGVKLNVTPVIINDDSVKLNINPEVSTITRFETSVQNGINVSNPVIDVRNINTELTAGDNEIILLGGLYSNAVLKTTRKTPVLGDMPGVFGDLFTALDLTDVKKQLVFFMKIGILKKTGTKNGFVGYDINKSATDVKDIGDSLHQDKDLFPVTNLRYTNPEKDDKGAVQK
ncbi:MAG: type II and III secretion system protein [Lentisphaerae bacterium]|nr:type II and III secretion system protein [Lentisphaerota bacterium]